MITIYGIRNCDTMKKAFAWLDANGVVYRFHDYKKEGAKSVLLRRWIDRLGWEKLLNRAGTTFRKLPDKDKSGIDADKAARLMGEQPSMIRRPVLEAGDRLIVGFDPREYQSLL